MKLFSSKICTVLALSAVLLASGCTKDFPEINTDPNESAVASPQNLLAPTLVAIVNNNINRNFRVNNEFMQVTVTTSDTREFHRYDVRVSESDYMWRNWYRQLTNIRDIYFRAEETQQAGYQTYKAISLVLDAWVGSLLTDTYGDVPYSESNKGWSEGNTAPKFDKQKDIYASIFQKLEEADSLLRLNAAIPTNFHHSDPIYQGNVSNWRKFGNAMHLRLLLRVAHTGEFGAQSKIREMIDGTPGEYPLFQSNEESAILRFSGVIPYQTEFHDTRDFDFNGDKGYSQFFINNLIEFEDPRLPVLATEAGLGFYGGMQSGYPQGSVPDRQSTLQLALKRSPLLGNILNYGELQFILAEAALRGYTDDDAQAHYENGVRASIELWGVSPDEDYFENPAVSYEEATTDEERLKKIQVQKYYAMLFTDFQQWFEYRRTRALDLYVGPGLKNEGRMPSRLNYPLLTRTFNPENYDEAVASMGGDGLNEKVWWEKTNLAR
jgi:hypothetical protein